MLRKAHITVALAAVVLLAGRARAVELYNADPMERVYAVADGDARAWQAPAGRALAPVRIAGPQNGVYSGMVIAAGGLSAPATVTDLKGPGGIIPASAVRLRYPSRPVDLGGGKRAYDAVRPYFDALADQPDPAEPIQPVLVTVHVPADAPPGEYRGTLAAGGKSVPVVVHVADYRLPDPAELAMWVSMNQSITTVRLRYGVEPFSDEHFALLEKSLALQGGLGDNVLYVPVIAENQMGDDLGLVHFRMEGDSLRPDLTAFEKYLELYVKHCGKPRTVILYVYDPYLGYKNSTTPDQRAYERNQAREKAGKIVRLTMVEGGRYVNRELPFPYDHAPGWKAAVDGVKALMAARDIDPKALRLGVTSDGKAADQVVTFFDQVAPGVTWAAFTHGYGGRAEPRGKDRWVDANGMVVTYAEYPDPTLSQEAVRAAGDPASPFVSLSAERDVHDDGSPPHVFRFVPDLAFGQNRGRANVGLARVGLDFWTLSDEALPGGRGNNGTVLGRYPLNPTNRLYRHATYAVTAPGPDGAVATLRYEMLRQGIQEASTRYQMTRRNDLPPALAERLRKTLEERAQAMVDPKTGGKGYKVINDGRWRERTEAFWDLAAEVLGKP